MYRSGQSPTDAAALLARTRENIHSNGRLQIDVSTSGDCLCLSPGVFNPHSSCAGGTMHVESWLE